ncbi:MAG: nucleoside recognition protein [Clostridia bacterium]|nr:nucleoside recognition protein [Clostridia bacterium]
MTFWTILRNGIKSGIQLTWDLTKTVIPVYFFIVILEHINALDRLSGIFEPFMIYFGLPGEAALPFVLGNVLNLYPALGAIEALSLNSKQVTIIAVMLLFSHSLPIELAITKKAGAKVLPILFIRLMAALISGFILNLVL